MSKTKNKLMDLNDHLFEQLERLNDATPDELETELVRAESIAKIGQTIVANANTILRAAKFADDRFDINNKAPELLLGDIDEKA